MTDDVVVVQAKVGRDLIDSFTDEDAKNLGWLLRDAAWHMIWRKKDDDPSPGSPD